MRQDTVWLLALGQTLTYAGAYYAFPALLPDLQAATGWSVAELAAGPTLAFLVMAVLMPLTGRLVDRGLGGDMLTLLPVVMAVSMVGLALASARWQWLAGWAVIGVAQAGCLYETCFAVLTRRLGDRARPAITKVTLVAGFAGTLSFPLGHFLGRALGGQGALACFALLVLLGAVPVNALAARRLRGGDPALAPRRDGAPGALRPALRKPAFWVLSAIFALLWLNHGMLLTYVLLLFQDRGASTGAAALAAASIGPAQVLGRLALMLGEARIGTGRATLIALISLVLASGVLWMAGMVPALVFVFAGLQGAGVGLLSILRPVLIAERLGRAGFGAISGAVAVAPLLATAAAPSLGALLLHLGGPALIYAVVAGMAGVALALGIGLLRRPAR